MNYKDFCYDLETYPNTFTAVIGDCTTRKCWTFEISDRKDERDQMIALLRQIKKNNGRMVGFNNLHFDYPVLHFILKNQQCTVGDIYDKAMAIINADDEDKFKHIIRPNKILIPQIDLFKIHHFDNQARMTSLKMLEFNMRSDNIEDLPFPVGTHLNDDQKDVLIKYNKHDMVQTVEFYHHSLPHIRFREQLTEKYNRDFMNHNDTKIGKDYFIMRLEEEEPGSCYHKVDGKRKPRQSRRKNINLGECILPYVKFDKPEFKAVLDWLSKKTIAQTKGVFIDILENELGDLANYCTMRKKRKKLFQIPTDKKMKEYRKSYPACWVSEEKLKSGKTSIWLNWNVADNLNCVVDGFQFDFGTGGIHGSIESKIVRSNKSFKIKDLDVKSFYPNIAIANKVHPGHLGELFCSVYRETYEQRQTYTKKQIENAMLKLALNGVYGDSNSQFSPFYDPKYTMTITINGQLSLCMLAERLMNVPSLEMIQINTDGLTVYMDRDTEEEVDRICKDWENMTKLELEGVDYELMAIRDVNSYIAKKVGGGVKRVGAYGWRHTMMEDNDLGWHQNHSSLVIPMAAEKALIEDEDVSYFIKQHKDKMDFMLRTKVPRSSRLVVRDEDGVENQVQNICRYYISKKGDGELIKIMPPLAKKKMAKLWRDPTGEKDDMITKTKTEETRWEKKGWEMVEEFELPPEERRIGINTGCNVKVCNDIKKFDGDIDFQYYIDEANKLINLEEYEHVL